MTEKGLKLIMDFEGCRLKAYKCPAGVWTIGYGHTQGVKEGQTITKQQAVDLLKKDIVVCEAQVMAMTPNGLTPYQLDALTSFAYNCGRKNLGNSTLLKYIKAGRSEAEIRSQFLRWNKANNKVLEGLTRRRKAEADLYFTPYKGEGNATCDTFFKCKIIVTFLIVTIFSSSCHQPKEVVRIDYQHDTITKIERLVDSVDRWHTHYEYLQGDTIRLVDTFYLAKWHTHTDTLHVTDTRYKEIDKPVEVVKYRVPLWCWLSLLAILAVIFVKIYRKIKDLRG